MILSFLLIQCLKKVNIISKKDFISSKVLVKIRVHFFSALLLFPYTLISLNFDFPIL